MSDKRTGKKNKQAAALATTTPDAAPVVSDLTKPVSKKKGK